MYHSGSMKDLRRFRKGYTQKSLSYSITKSEEGPVVECDGWKDVGFSKGECDGGEASLRGYSGKKVRLHRYRDLEDS